MCLLVHGGYQSIYTIVVTTVMILKLSVAEGNNPPDTKKKKPKKRKVQILSTDTEDEGAKSNGKSVFIFGFLKSMFIHH